VLTVKIAVVSAYPIGFNTGMFSSDLALRSFLARHNIEAELTTFSIGPDLTIPRHGAEGGQLTYHSLSRWEQLSNFDRIVFWGDFLHSRRLHLQDMPWMTQNSAMSISPEELDERVFSGLLLEAAPDAVLEKTICFGGTIYINSLADAGDRRYTAALTRLFSTARLVLMRDPVSAALAAHYGAMGAALGVDCALLLQPFGALDWTHNGSASKAIGFSFGRGPAKRKSTTRLMHQLVEGLGRHLQLADRVPLEWLRANEAAPLADLVGKLEKMHRSAVIVTDTYHCAVNAWREGVPAICIGMGAEHPAGTLADKKKELFLGMFGATDYYVFSESLRKWGGVRSTIRRLEPVLEHAPTVIRTIRQAAGRAEVQLAQALRA
jgi:hypothetical protein